MESSSSHEHSNLSDNRTEVMPVIKKCGECNSYTMKEEHCGVETETSRPPKFSYPDNYGEYRRKTKRS